MRRRTPSAVKILIVTHVLRRGDGQGRVNYEIARYAAGAGHQVHLLASAVADDLLALPQVSWTPVVSPKLPGRLLQYQAFALQTTSWLRKHAGEFDVVNVNGGITYAPSDVNSVHFVHSGWLRSPQYSVRPGPRGLYQRAYSLWNAFLERQSFRQAGTVVAVSEKVAAELRTIGVPAARIQVITNGVETTEFVPSADVDRSQLGLPSQGFLALFAGDLQSFRKNCDTVLMALRDVPGVQLAVAGHLDGSPFPALAKELGLAERVHFLGYRRDMADLMRAADVFIFPSRYEACSLVLLEALSSGLPTITATTVGGCELMTAECGAVLDDPDDVAGLARILREFSLKGDQLESMRLAARAVAERNTWSVMAAKYVALYERVAATRG